VDDGVRTGVEGLVGWKVDEEELAESGIGGGGRLLEDAAVEVMGARPREGTAGGGLRIAGTGVALRIASSKVGARDVARVVEDWGRSGSDTDMVGLGGKGGDGL
jgi:hypothetical protein